MEQNSQESVAPESADVSTETAAPVRRRASRRVSAAAGEAVAIEVVAPTESVAATDSAEPTDSADSAEPKKRVSRARKKVDVNPEDIAAESAESSTDAAEVSTVAAVTADAPAAATEGAEPVAPATKAKAPARRRQAAPAAEAKEAAAAEGSDAPAAAAATDATQATDPAEAVEGSAPAAPQRRNTRTRSKKPAAVEAVTAQSDAGKSAEGGETQSEAAEEKQGDKSENGSNNRGPNNNGNNNGDNQARTSRTRQRERKRRGAGDDEPEISEDDVLLPIAGILDVLDNYAFVRTSGYLPGTGDVYVSLGQVKKYNMRKGDAVVGAIRQPRESDGGGRQKYNAIVKVDSINSKPVEEQLTRPDFADLTPVYPDERLRLETDAAELGSRVIDLFAPVGKGQRGLVVGPHESGKSTALQQIARAVAQNQPDAHLMLVLVDERPEEVTALQRTINGEVIASTFDRPAEDHATVVELAVERAKRLVELGHDVVVLIDSLTSLARAHNLGAPAAVRVPAGSLDAAAVFPIKRVLSAARNIENGGSLTIIATVSAQPESRLDEALLGEIEGIANMQLRLSGDAADSRVFPAVDLLRSSTRNEQLLTSEAEAKLLNQVRRGLQGANALEGLENVLEQLGRTSSNVEFLAVTQRAQV